MYKILTILLMLMLTATAQDKNKISIDGKSGKPMLVGLCDRQAFVDTNFAWWFNSGYKYYSPKASVVTMLNEVKTDYTIKIIMGTWCSDSRREVPRFYKLLDELKLVDEEITLINVDRMREVPEINMDDLNILLVPTFIIYRGGKEIGRIVETPIETLEKDLLNILSNSIVEK